MAFDWGAIEAEYVTTQISQRALAKKWGIKWPTLQARCRRGEWKTKRDAHASSVVTGIIQKAAEAKLDAGAACTEYMREAAIIFSQAFPVMAERIVREADVKGAEIYSRTLNSHIDSLAKLFGTAEDNKTIRVVMSDELKELTR